MKSKFLQLRAIVVSAQGSGGGSNGQRLRPVWSAVLLAPDDGSGKDHIESNGGEDGQ